MQSEITDDVFFSIVEQSQDAVIISDSSSLVLYWNAAATEIFGYAPNEMRGKDFHDFICPEHLRPKAKSSIRTHITSDGLETVGMVGSTVTLPALHKTRTEPFFIELSISSMRDRRGKLWIYAFLRDCTARVLNEQTLQAQVETDALTNIPNRRAFQNSLEALQDKPVTLCLFDLDFFKQINDKFGHDMGDETLILFAQEFLACLPKPCLIARTGGEEFAAIYTDIAMSDVLSELETCRELYHEKIRKRAGMPLCTFSAGMVTTSRLSSSRHLLKHADIAMYRAKEAGRNRIEVYS